MATNAIQKWGNDVSVDAMIFSKDRPYHVHGLLESLFQHSLYLNRVFVIFHASFPCAAAMYKELERQFPAVHFHNDMEQGFRTTVLQTLQSMNSSHVVPMVDELVWIREVDFMKFARLLDQISPRGTVQVIYYS